MRSSVFSCLNLRNLAISFLFIGIFLPPASLAQQPFREAPSPTTNCPLNASSEKPSTGLSCGLQTLAALPGTDSVPILAPTGNPYQNRDPDTMSIASGLVLAPGRTIQDARKSFEMAARRGDAAAQVNLAILYLYGWGAPQNFGTALYWLKSASHQGNSRACTNLGLLYWQGWGVRTDYSEALKYFRKGADRGDTSAMVDLGYMNDYGVGTSPDHSVAAEWYRRAAERGDALAQNNLADLYLRGEGVPQNDDLAFAWFEKAALQGNTGARIKLGFLYANGRATRKDAETAYAWIMAAALAGDQRGQSYLAALEAQLSPDQAARAKQRAKALQTVPSRPPSDVAFVR
jgi:TPR repeat protein